MTDRPEGFVLAGGRSSRFGTDKALAVHGGKPLLAHALGVLRALGIRPRVVTADPLPYRSIATAFVVGERPGRGPVEGLRAAIASTPSPWSLVLGTDMPGVAPEILGVLVAEAGRPDPPPAICFTDGAEIHPFPGIYSHSTLPVLEGLPEGTSMHRFLEIIEAGILPPTALPPGTDPAAAFHNVNRPGDLGGGEASSRPE